MSYKLNTLLTHFRFNRTRHTIPLSVDWYKYDLDEDLEDNIVPFSYEELNEFQSFTLRMEFNFTGTKEYKPVKDHDLPTEVLDDLVINERISFPECLILKSKPQLLLGQNLAKFVQIVLLDKAGRENFDYNLPFGVIGKILV